MSNGRSKKLRDLAINCSFIENDESLDARTDEELLFLLHLEQFLSKTITRPRMDDEYVNLYKLARVVRSLEGFTNIQINKRWKEVAKEMGARILHVSSFKTLKNAYANYIEPFINHLNSSKRQKCCKNFIGFEEEHESILNEVFYDDSNEEDEEEEEEESIPETNSISTRRSNSKSTRRNRTTSEESETDERSIETNYSRSRKHAPVIDVVVGDQIMVRYLNFKKQYKAIVLDTREVSGVKEIFVHYHGWADSYNEWVKESLVVSRITDTPMKAHKRKRGRKPKTNKAIVSPILKDEVSSEKKRTRHTYNSLQDEYIQAALENSLKEFQGSSGVLEESNVSKKKKRIREESEKSDSEKEESIETGKESENESIPETKQEINGSKEESEEESKHEAPSEDESNGVFETKKKRETKNNESKREIKKEVKKAETRKNENKKIEAKKTEIKKEETKKADVKKVEPKKTETKKVVPKVDFNLIKEKIDDYATAVEELIGSCKGSEREELINKAETTLNLAWNMITTMAKELSDKK